MGRSRGRERQRLVGQLRDELRAADADRANDREPTDWHLAKPDQVPAPELTRVGLLNVRDLGAFVEFRTAGNPGSRHTHHHTAGRLVGFRPTSYPSTTPDSRDLVIQMGNAQNVITVSLGEPITIRRTAP